MSSILLHFKSVLRWILFYFIFDPINLKNNKKSDNVKKKKKTDKI